MAVVPFASGFHDCKPSVYQKQVQSFKTVVHGAQLRTCLTASMLPLMSGVRIESVRLGASSAGEDNIGGRVCTESAAHGGTCHDIRQESRCLLSWDSSSCFWGCNMRTSVCFPYLLTWHTLDDNRHHLGPRQHAAMRIHAEAQNGCRTANHHLNRPYIGLACQLWKPMTSKV